MAIKFPINHPTLAHILSHEKVTLGIPYYNKKKHGEPYEPFPCKMTTNQKDIFNFVSWWIPKDVNDNTIETWETNELLNAILNKPNKYYIQVHSKGQTLTYNAITFCWTWGVGKCQHEYESLDYAKEAIRKFNISIKKIARGIIPHG